MKVDIDGQKIELDGDWIMIGVLILAGVALLPKKYFDLRELVWSIGFLIVAMYWSYLKIKRKI